MTLRLRYSVRSHVGRVREGNEDSAYAGSRLALVADGMGGHAAGEVASSAVVATLAQLDEDEAGLDVLEVLASAVQASNEHLRQLVDTNAALEGMGTTLTAMLSSGTRLGIAHVGDSRAYLFREGEFSQITRDQTLVQRMVDEGRITVEQAETHPQRSLLTQALDGRAGVEPDLSVREARRGDRYLLCSDGLSSYVPVENIAETLQVENPDEAAEQLIDLALRAGAPDNVTVVIADVVDDAAGLPDTPVVGGAAAEQDAVPSAATAVVLPGGASKSAAQAKPRRGAASPPAGSPGSPGSPGSQLAQPSAPPVGQPVDTGVYSRPEPAPGVQQTPPAGMEPIGVEPPLPPMPPRRPWYRHGLVLALTGLTVVLVAAVIVTWAIIASSWYVARDGETVALFHGIQSKPLGISLSDVEQRGSAFNELQPVDQERVNSGIVAKSRADGVCILLRLKHAVDEEAYARAKRAEAKESPSSKPTFNNAPVRRPDASPQPSGSPRPSASPSPKPSPSPSAIPTPAPLPKSCP